MDVAVMTANICPRRDTRRARIGSLRGIPAVGFPLELEGSRAASKTSCSTGLIPGVKGVEGVMGVAGTGTGTSRLEAESAVRREAPSALSISFSSGVGGDRPSWETVMLTWADWLLLVAYIRGVPTGQYMAGCLEPEGWGICLHPGQSNGGLGGQVRESGVRSTRVDSSSSCCCSCGVVGVARSGRQRRRSRVAALLGDSERSSASL